MNPHIKSYLVVGILGGIFIRVGECRPPARRAFGKEPIDKKKHHPFVCAKGGIIPLFVNCP